MSSIEVSWPGSPLSESGWRTRVEALAVEAEAMVGRPCSPQAQARLAVWFVGLLWPTLSPEVVAGSCRASLLLGAPGVLLAPAPVDQLAEVQDRLWQLLEAAQDRPEAAVVESPQVLLLERPPETPAPPLAPAPADLSHLSEAEFVALAPQGYHGVAEVRPQPSAPPKAPDSYLSPAEVAELLEISESTINLWRRRGRFGAGWGKRGRGFAYSMEAVEALMDGLIPPALEELINEIRQEREAL
jgi:hypothetical protein